MTEINKIKNCNNVRNVKRNDDILKLFVQHAINLYLQVYQKFRSFIVRSSTF